MPRALGEAAVRLSPTLADGEDEEAAGSDLATAAYDAAGLER